MNRAAWAVESDGRRQRAVRTRTAILDALIALVGEGIAQPTARQIAARAKVAIRSIGQHFASREQLITAAAALAASRIDRAEPVAASLPLPDRIAAFVRARAVFLESSRAFRIASQQFAGQSPALVQVLDAFAKARRADVGRVFAAELAARPEAARAVLLDALDLAVCGRAWDGLRDELGLPPAAAMTRVEAIVRGLFAGA